MFVCAVTFPIVFLSLNPNPAMLITIMAAGFSVATFGATMIMFGPKSALLWEGADVDENFGIVRSEESSSQQSTGTNALHRFKMKMAAKSKLTSSRDSNTAVIRANGPGKAADSTATLKYASVPRSKSSRHTYGKIHSDQDDEGSKENAS